MQTIKYLVIHHSGGLGNDRKASSQHLTLSQINNAHKERWPEFISSLGYWVGYNIVIFPDGHWVQTRKIAEETAAVKSFNSSSVSICLVGNFVSGVNSPTNAQIETLKKLGRAILACDVKKIENAAIQVVPGAVLSISRENIVPHRSLQKTECYGDLPDSWARDILEPEVPTKDKSGLIRAILKEIKRLQRELARKLRNK